MSFKFYIWLSISRWDWTERLLWKPWNKMCLPNLHCMQCTHRNSWIESLMYMNNSIVSLILCGIRITTRLGYSLVHVAKDKDVFQKEEKTRLKEDQCSVVTSLSRREKITSRASPQHHLFLWHQESIILPAWLRYQTVLGSHYEDRQPTRLIDTHEDTDRCTRSWCLPLRRLVNEPGALKGEDERER